MNVIEFTCDQCGFMFEPSDALRMLAYDRGGCDRLVCPQCASETLIVYVEEEEGVKRDTICNLNDKNHAGLTDGE